ncbi:MAG TPA: NPCBM/NEW2 domain-containing protein [Pyrinomonadaceae bacterium]|nr:NPCBM/NEW2 domain-containing protein [Pyrinomonadaceae bacterium]
MTVQRSWDSTKGPFTSPVNYISASTQYDEYGNPTLIIDARGTQTELTYGPVNGHIKLYPTIIKVAYGTAVEQATNRQYDFYTGAVTREIDPNNVATVTTRDALGRPKLVKAAEGIAAKETRTETEYLDAQRMVIVRSDLTNTGDKKLVSIQHYDQLGRVRLSRRLENATTENEMLETDGVKVQTRYLTVNPCAPTNDTSCLSANESSLASYVLVSNPYRAASSALAGNEPSMGWARSRLNKGGRTVETQTFNGAALPAPWGTNASSSGAVTTSYDAEFTTVTDQAGKARRSMANAFGQPARVDEPDKNTGSLGTTNSPVQPTTYTYDALGNLTQVIQDTQTRTFNYSSLSHLISTTNPESGTVSYTYDAGGNLLTKTDARSITITYTYDALSRNKTVDYSNTPVNPDIDRHYDNPTAGMYGRGRFWYDYMGGNYSTGSEVEHRAVDAYDALGQPLTQRQHFKTGSVWSGAYTTSRTYARGGMVETQTLPSGHSVSYSYDAAGRPETFSGNLGDGATRSYSTNSTYDAAGRMTRESFGTQTPLYHKKHYNTRGQLYDVRLGSATDEWSWNRGAIIAYYDGAHSWSNSGNVATGADNNGNVTRTQTWVPGDDAVTTYALSDDYFTYDALNRLSSVSEYKDGSGVTRSLAFTQAYTYDRWGNRQINQAGTTQTLAPEMRTAFTVDAATNRLGVPAGQIGAMTYDNAGNLTHDSYTGRGDRAYDAENRMTSAVIGINSTAAYAYDADGRRVRRSTPNGTVWQIYGFDGELLAEYAANAATNLPQKEYGYRAGELLVTAEGGGTSTYLSDLNWTYSATDYYQTTKDLAVAGTPLTLNGTAYSKGLGVHANSEVRYALGGNYQTFTADVGVDDYTGAQGSVTFEVWADGVKLYDSGVMTGATATKSATVGVTGKQELKLVVSQAGDGPSYDHADWAGARLIGVPPVNVAAASQGATTSASSVYPYGTYTAAATINGDRKGVNWGAGGGWNDATPDAYPDWVEVQFAGAKTIDEIDVFTCQDNYASPSTPTETMTFSLYGLTAFEVQYYNSTTGQWVTVQGGSVTGNNLVWRKFTFPAVTTSKIRVHTSAGLASYSRLTEIEAYESRQAVADARVQWLVSDHLGTPRMVSGFSGSLSAFRRHDYLPFGEEIGVGIGGRTTNQGYSVVDGLRQGYTGYEKDGETGLNFAQARYYSPTLGRFTSVDPLLASGKATEPQSWNRYAYVVNNPLKLTDPNGLDPTSRWGYRDVTIDGRQYRQFGYITGEWNGGSTHDSLGQRWEEWTGGSYYIFGDNTAAYLGPGGNHLEFSLANLSQEMQSSLLATQVAGGSFSTDQLSALTRATADRVSQTPQFALQKAVAGMAGAGGASLASNWRGLFSITFYRGTSFYDAAEVAGTGAINTERLAAGQIGNSYDFGSGLYFSRSRATAEFFSTIHGAGGRQGGPAVLEMSTSRFGWWRLRRSMGAIDNAPISNMPGHLQSYVPPESINYFNRVTRFKF